MTDKIINVLADFSKYPAGRLRGDGDFSAQKFREEYLAPNIKNKNIERIIIKLDGVAGYSSSFLEEAFGGLVRSGISKRDILAKIKLDSADKILVSEIEQYIKEA